MSSHKVFLGGALRDKSWQKAFLAKLAVPVFVSSVENTSMDYAVKELDEKKLCDIHVYIITSKIQGVHTAAEIIESTYTPGKHVMLWILPEGFEMADLASWQSVAWRVQAQQQLAFISDNVERPAELINEHFATSKIIQLPH